MKNSVIQYSENLSYSFDQHVENDSENNGTSKTFAIANGTGTCTDEHIVIPPSYNGIPVECFASVPVFSEYEHYLADFFGYETMLNRYLGFFYTNDNVKSITLPSSIRYISMGSLTKIKQDLEIIIDPDNPHYYSKGNCIIEKNHTPNHEDAVICGAANCVIPEDERIKYIFPCAFRGQNNIENMTIPSNILLISKEAYYRAHIKKINFQEGLRVIEDCAFSMCRWLTNFTLPNSIQYIGPEAFNYCSSITELSIPYGISVIGANRGHFVANSNNGGRIGEDAFKNCFALKILRLPKSLIYFKSSVFFNCKNLETIYYEGTVNEWNNIEKLDIDAREVKYLKFNTVRIICSNGISEIKIYYNSLAK